VSLPTPGQNALLTFAGTINQVVSASATIGTFPGGCSSSGFRLEIVKPDSNLLTGAYSCISGATLNSVTLPVTGNYILRLNPESQYTGNSTLTLTSP